MAWWDWFKLKKELIQNFDSSVQRNLNLPWSRRRCLVEVLQLKECHHLVCVSTYFVSSLFIRPKKLFTVSTGPKSHFCVLGFKLNWFPRIVDKDKYFCELLDILSMIRDGCCLQSVWIFGKVPNSLPSLIFEKSYCNFVFNLMFKKPCLKA